MNVRELADALRALPEDVQGLDVMVDEEGFDILIQHAFPDKDENGRTIVRLTGWMPDTANTRYF
ncbi:MAG: hypothetical protein JOZ10_16150 [Acidobacteria bacterium]|nr:hypothetical protein [Acidobacteriota bacterium]